MRRYGTHGRNVTEVGSDSLETDVVPSRRLTDDEMAVLDHRIDDSHLLPAWRRRVDSPVIADADDDVLFMIERILFNGIDESKFTNI